MKLVGSPTNIKTNLSTADENVIELSEAPAGTSTTRISVFSWITSRVLINSYLALTSKFNSSVNPLPPDKNFNPRGPGARTSFTSDFETKMSCAVFFGLTPRRMWELARPKSASKRTTLEPSLDKVRDKLTAMLVLPTPPLPLATAIAVSYTHLRAHET